MAHCSAMICQQVTLSGDDEWPKVADAMIEAGSSTHLVETAVACYRLSGCSAYRVHALICLTTAASLTHEAAQTQEPLSTEPSWRAVLVGPNQIPSETCSEARKMGRRMSIKL